MEKTLNDLKLFSETHRPDFATPPAENIPNTYFPSVTPSQPAQTPILPEQ